MKQVNYRVGLALAKCYEYKIKTIAPLAENISQIILSPPLFSKLHYQAGQYVNVLHHEGQKSPLSIACAPRKDGLIEFHLSHKPDNLLAQDLMYLAKNSKSWKIEEAIGDCTLNRFDLSRPIIFVAQGTGFASVKAILEALIMAAPELSIYFYWVIRNEAMMYMVDVLQTLQLALPNLAITPLFADQYAGEADAFLHLTEEIKRDVSELAHHQICVSGAYPFVMMAYDWFIHHGGDRGDFFSDMLSVL